MNGWIQKLALTTALIGTAATVVMVQSQIAASLSTNNWIRETLSQVSLEALAQRTNRQENERRIALVIGNAAYKEGELDNPVNDANDMAAALRELGFEVILKTDVELREMEEALNEFSQKLTKGGVGVFYFAGHGMQSDEGLQQAENYLIPLNAKLQRQQDLRYNALPLGRVLGAMEETDNRVNIIILDACRDNPLARSWQSRGGTVRRGLAPVKSTGHGTLIEYATAPGQWAADADEEQGRNGAFTGSILKYIREPNLEIEALFKKVRADVAQKTNNFQIPWESNSLIGNFSFNPQSNSVVESPSTTIQTTSTPTPPPTSNPTTNPIPTNLTVIAAAPGVDKEQMYTRLDRFLRAGKWRKADDQTTHLVEQVGEVGRDNSDYDGELSKSEIENLSCSDLRRINTLWLNSSNGKFGFSVQKDIWISVGGTPGEFDWEIYQKFAERIGWRKGGEWLSYSDLTFNTNAPSGHLPVFGGYIGSFLDYIGRGHLERAEASLARVASCNL